MAKTSANQLAKKLKISRHRGLEAVIKAQLTAGITEVIQRQRITHQELAKRSGLSRTTVTGILSGSLQRVSIDRILRLVEAAGLVAEVRLKKAA